jgi:hypothetical protein
MLVIIYILLFAAFGAGAGAAYRCMGPSAGRSRTSRTSLMLVGLAATWAFARFVVGDLGSHEEVTTPVGIIAGLIAIVLFLRVSGMLRSTQP